MGKVTSSTHLLFQSKLLCFSVLHLHRSLSRSIHLSLFLPFFLWRTQVCPPNSSFHLLFLCLLHSCVLLYPPFFPWIFPFNDCNFCFGVMSFVFLFFFFFSLSTEFVWIVLNSWNTIHRKKNLFFLDITDTSLFELCSNSDQVEMENCNGVVVVSAIFNHQDKRGYFLKKAKSATCFCFILFVPYMGVMCKWRTWWYCWKCILCCTWSPIYVV